ncbi:unnamed protein product [Tilletia controversa]|nr:unnamed protein product [Tilletia controversa]
MSRTTTTSRETGMSSTAGMIAHDQVKHEQGQDGDDEYARWTSAALSQVEGPAAAMARLLKRPRHDDELSDGIDREDEADAQERRDFNARDSRSIAAHGGQRHRADNDADRSRNGNGNEALSDANVGHQLLLKFGWAGTGTGLGMYAQGRPDPLSLSFSKLGADTSGIGKLRSTTSALEDALAISRLHELNSEKLATESDSQRSAREHDVRKRDEVRAEVLASLSVFRCDICDGKQYANAHQFSEHTNSYAHHHRKRLRELAANQRALLSGSTSGAGGSGSGAGTSERRREKERKREEREMRAFAQAAGVNLGPDPNSSSSSTAASPSSSGGWKKVTSSAGFQKVGAKSNPPIPATTLPPPPPPPSERSFAQPPPPPHPTFSIMATTQLPPAELARALRAILSLSSSSSSTSQRTDISSVYSTLASLALDESATESAALWAELALLAAPSSQTLSAALQPRQARPSSSSPTAVGFTIVLDLDRLSARAVPLELDWQSTSRPEDEEDLTRVVEPAGRPLPARNGTLRYWPADSDDTASSPADMIPTKDAPADRKKRGPSEVQMHLISLWHSYSLFVPSTTYTALARRISTDAAHSSGAITRSVVEAVAEAHDRCESARLYTGTWPNAHVVAAFAARLINSVSRHSADSEASGGGGGGRVLSSTVVLPFSIGSRAWNSDVPSLPSDLATFSGNGSVPDAAPAVVEDGNNAGRALWSRLGRKGKDLSRASSLRKSVDVDRNVDCNGDSNVDCNGDVNNDGAATGPNSGGTNSSHQSKAAVPETSSNGGDNAAVAAAGVASHGPTFSVVQSCNNPGSGSGDQTKPTSSSNRNLSNNILNIGFGISFKFPGTSSSSSSRSRQQEREERDRNYALQLAAARNAASSAAVVVAVPGSSAIGQSKTGEGGGGSNTQVGPAASNKKKSQPRPVAQPSKPQRLHSGNGQVSQSFMDWIPEDERAEAEADAEEEGDEGGSTTHPRAGMTTKTTVTTTTVTVIDRFPQAAPGTPQEQRISNQQVPNPNSNT